MNSWSDIKIPTIAKQTVQPDSNQIQLFKLGIVAILRNNKIINFQIFLLAILINNNYNNNKFVVILFIIIIVIIIINNNKWKHHQEKFQLEENNMNLEVKKNLINNPYFFRQVLI